MKNQIVKVYPVGRCNNCMTYFHEDDRTYNEGICRNCGNGDALMDMPKLATAPELLEAVKYAMELIGIARQYFPKSIKNSDTFKLENTCATLNNAIAKAEGGK